MTSYTCNRQNVYIKICPLRARPVAELFRPADRLTAATHPERFSFIPDPDDRKFAALAQAAGAILISNDKHLLRYRDNMDFRVLTPGGFGNTNTARTKPQGRRDTTYQCPVLSESTRGSLPLSSAEIVAISSLVNTKLKMSMF